MSDLGYIEQKGICHGFSLRWLEAALTSKDAEFKKRARAIKRGGTVLVAKIKQRQNEKWKNIEEKDTALMDILAFFDSVQLYQSPMAHSSIFGECTTQENIESVSKLASSDDILNLGGLAKIYSDVYVYSKKDIAQLLEKLSVVYTTSSSKDPIGLVLSSYNHSIALVYRSDLKWELMDINPDNSMSKNIIDSMLHAFTEIFSVTFGNQQKSTTIFTTHKDKTINALAKVIPSMLYTMKNKSSTMHAPIAATLLTTKHNLHLFTSNNALESLKKDHAITKKIASRMTTGASLAFIAAQNNYPDVIDALAKHKGCLDKKINSGHTAAHIAAQNNNTKVLNRLAKHGVDLNTANDKCTTPIQIATMLGNIKAIRKLVKLGVDVHQTIHSGCTLAHIAILYEQTNILSCLKMLGIDLNKANDEGLTPIIYAAALGHTEAINTLVQCGVDLHQTIHSGYTLAHTAILFKQTKILSYLKMLGIDLNKASDKGLTPIMFAAALGYTEAINTLVLCGVDLHQTDRFGRTLAHTAAQFGQIKVIRLLARLRVDVNKASNNGKTPSYVAAQNGHANIVKELTKYQFKPTKTSVSQRAFNFIFSHSPRYCAWANGDKQVFQLLSFARKKNVLLEQINEFKEYGLKMSAQKNNKSTIDGKRAVALATDIEAIAQSYISQITAEFPNYNAISQHRKDFHRLLEKGYKTMGRHNASLKSILANIAIAATGIGLLLIAAKYVYTGSAFFSETRRQKKLHDIKHTLGKIKAYESIEPVSFDPRTPQ